MILPVIAYGDPVLKKVGEEITKDYPNLDQLLENMWETMYNSRGIGLAAPQIGKSIRIFLVDTIQLEDEEDENNPYSDGIKKVFINAQILEYGSEKDRREEGCLSIPNVHGDIDRPTSITLKYMDEQFQEHTETFSGFNARVIQHEYDHIEGVLFTEKLSTLKRRLLKSKLDKISKGQITVSYKMRFPLKK